MIKGIAASFVFLSLSLISGSAIDFLPSDPGRIYVLAKKGRHLPIGSVVESTSKMSMKEGDLVIEFAGEKMEGGMMMVMEEVRKVEFLEEGKCRLTVLKGKSKQKMFMDGEAAPMEEEDDALVGKPVIVSKKDGKWTAKLEKGEPKGDEKEELKDINDEFNNDSDLEAYGDVPRKVGDEWEADGAKVMGVKGMVGKIKIKFVRVEKFQGTDCAVLDCRFKLTGVDDENEGFEMTLKGKAVIHRSLKDLEDIHADFKGEMEMNGFMDGGPDLEMEMNGHGAVTMDFVTKVTRP